MRHKKKRLIAALLAGMMVCSNFSTVSFAEGKGMNGWRWDGKNIESWVYYDNGEPRKNDFAPSPTGVEGVSTMYYLGNDGHLLLNNDWVEGPNGEGYKLTPGGAVKGGQLGSYSTEKGIWFTEPATGVLAANKWWHIEDEDKLCWFYFDKNNQALCDTTRKINSKWYHFNEKGHMTERDFVSVRSENGEEYRAYAQMQGDFAENKWLYIDGQWYYFKNKEIKGWNAPVPVALTESTEIDGSFYEFDENGCLISDRAPYRPVASAEISTSRERVHVGEKVTVNVDILVASGSNASPATMSNAEKREAAPGKDENGRKKSGKAYDAWIQYKEPGKSSIGIMEYKNEKMTWTYTPTKEGDTEISLYVDGDILSSLTISAEVDQDKEDKPDYMRQVFAGILNSDLPGEEIVEQLANQYSKLAKADAVKLRNDKNILADLETFEKLYISGQGMGRYKEDFESVKKLVDTKQITIVGAFLNADITAEEPVNFSIKEDLITDISGIAGNKKISLDLNLSGGNIDTSALAIPITVTMPIPGGIAKDRLKLYHINHKGEPEEMALAASALAEGKARFTTDSLSTFVFAESAVDEGSHGSSGGGSSSGGSSKSTRSAQTSTIPETPGSWKQTADGWQFQKADGTLYSNTWIYVNGKWYWLEPDGIMAAGWKALNGRKYYLMPSTGEMVTGWIADGQNWYYAGSDGAIVTGWVQTDGKWYYLAEDGQMLSSTVTPDNYRVDDTGAWVQS